MNPEAAYQITIIIICALFVAAIYLMDRANKRERKDILDRFMSRNLTEYAHIRGETPKTEPIKSAHDKNIEAWHKPENKP